MRNESMQLMIIAPDRQVLEAGVEFVQAEAENGFFGLMPNHIDFVTSLVPGILTYRRADTEYFIALDEGILVKSGSEVKVATRTALAGSDLEVLHHAVRDRFRVLDEQEVLTRKALDRLEADFVRRFIEIRKGRGQP